MNGVSAETTALDTAVAAAQIAFYLSPLLIAGATLFLAWWRFKIFRVREPAIKAELEVSSRRCSPSYNAVNAIATLTNTSRVSVQISRLQWWVVVLSPYEDSEVESKQSFYESLTTSDPSVEFPWNVHYNPLWEGIEIVLEPGESTAIGISRAIPDWVRAVEVVIEVDSPSGQEGERWRWIARCPHDVDQEASHGVQNSD